MQVARTQDGQWAFVVDSTDAELTFFVGMLMMWYAHSPHPQLQELILKISSEIGQDDSFDDYPEEPPYQM